MADRGFLSYGAVASLKGKGVDSLMRVAEKKLRRAILAKCPKADNFDVLISWEKPDTRPPSMTAEEFNPSFLRKWGKPQFHEFLHT